MELLAQRADLRHRLVGVALVSTSSGELDTVTLGLPDAGRLLRSQIPAAPGAALAHALTPRSAARPDRGAVGDAGGVLAGPVWPHATSVGLSSQVAS